MERMSEYLEVLHLSLLASPISCCFHRLQDQPAETAFSPSSKLQCPLIEAKIDLVTAATDNSITVWKEQPVPNLPPVYASGTLDTPPKAPSKTFPSIRRSVRRRPTISAPSDFRRVGTGHTSPVRRTGAFRPLQLSIYEPGNRLSDLPQFCEDGAEDDTEEVEGLMRPPQALVKSRSDPTLLRNASTSFSIPRRPVGSRSLSADTLRFNMDSRSAQRDYEISPRSRAVSHVSQFTFGSMEGRPSIATTRSNQEFLDSLNGPLPPLPPLPPARVRSSSSPEPAFTIYRKASEQSLRLRAHLEERQSLERRLSDSITEERSPVSPESASKGPQVLPKSDQADSGEAIKVSQGVDISDKHDLAQQDARIGRQDNVVDRPKSSSGSPILLNFTPKTNFQGSSEPSEDTLCKSESIYGTAQSAVSTRLSQWLSNAPPIFPKTEPQHDIVDRPSTPDSLDSFDLPASQPWTSPRSVAHTQQSSITSYWTIGAHGREASLDMDKSPIFTIVGVAF